jgi:hypothetical protein
MNTQKEVFEIKIQGRVIKGNRDKIIPASGNGPLDTERL